MKRFLTWVCLGLILFAGVFASAKMAGWERSYDGSEADYKVSDLRDDPAQGADAVKGKGESTANAIIQQNLDKTHAVNDVTSIVFDFRGYDTMGEAFILITAVAGTMVILFNKKEEKKEDEQK